VLNYSLTGGGELEQDPMNPETSVTIGLASSGHDHEPENCSISCLGTMQCICPGRHKHITTDALEQPQTPRRIILQSYIVILISAALASATDYYRVTLHCLCNYYCTTVAERRTVLRCTTCTLACTQQFVYT
jgi:hypothetical protein